MEGKEVEVKTMTQKESNEEKKMPKNGTENQPKKEIYVKSIEEREEEIPEILKTQELSLGPRERYQQQKREKNENRSRMDNKEKEKKDFDKERDKKSPDKEKKNFDKEEKKTDIEIPSIETNPKPEEPTSQEELPFRKVEPTEEPLIPSEKGVDEILEEIEEDLGKKPKKKSTHSKKFWLCFDVICFLLALAGFIALQSISPKIHLQGDKVVRLEYGTKYEEKGAKATYFKEDVTKEMKIQGTVNTNKIGTYTIRYSIEIGNYHVEKKRTVEVIDTKAPVLTLTGNETATICPNGTYQEEGVTAIDEYEGDLTEKIVRTEEKGKIIYTVEDSSKNKATIERKIEEKDDEKPTITLKGGNIYLQPGTDYKEPGYTATDNCDNDITKNVTVSGSINKNQTGNYTLTYEVSDTYGNKTSTTRTITVSNRTDPDSGTLKTGAIYLTFDDGPSSATTGRILDILKEEGIKATFFVTMNGPDSLIEREFNEGHTIALHTATHDYAYIYASRENYFEDLNRVSSRVKRIAGYETKIIRFPGGTSNTVSRHYSQGIMSRLSEEVLNLGYRYYDWNVDASDAWQCAKQSVSDKKSCVYNNVVNNLSKSRANVVLMHDIKEHTVQALRDIIHYAKNNGYTFEVIDMNTKMVRFQPLN